MRSPIQLYLRSYRLKWLEVAFLWTNWSLDFSAFLADVDAVHEDSLLGLPGPKGLYTAPMLIGIVILLSFGGVSMAHNAQCLMMAKDEKFLKILMFAFPFMAIATTVMAGILGLGGAVVFPGLESGDQVIGKVTASVPAIIWTGAPTRSPSRDG